MDKTELLRSMPQINILLNHPVIQSCKLYTQTLLTDCAREVVDTLRNAILKGEVTEASTIDSIAHSVIALAEKYSQKSLRPVINCTGVVLHTNLGRAPLGSGIAKAISEVCEGYSTLEYDTTAGGRGSRHSHVEALITSLSGAEAAIAVNNNAAAVMLALSALTEGGEVVVSRGELVEIGGSFRVPDIMRLSGAHLKEVGTTNKTKPSDYSAAVTENTAAFLKIHTSNFKVIGFTEEVSVEDMAKVADSRFPVIHDLGSGSFYDPSVYGIADEPWVAQSIKQGADVVTFSGDKLLGGPQAGIIAGKKKYIDIIKKHPLARAVRIDKLSLAALEETLRLYLYGDRQQIPTVAMLSMTADKTRERSEKLAEMIKQDGITTSIVPISGEVGGGSVPGQQLDGYSLCVEVEGLSAAALEKRLRMSTPPVIVRIHKDKVIIDPRTVPDDSFSLLAEIVLQTRD